MTANNAVDAQSATLLVVLTGHDAPGVTADVFDALGGEVLDVEQTIVQGRLVQSVLVGSQEPGEFAEIESRVREVAARHQLEVAIEAGGQEMLDHRRSKQQVTLLAAPLCPHDTAALARRITAVGGNIERISRIARYPVTAVELQVSGTAVRTLRRALAEEAAGRAVDVAVQPIDLHTHGSRLIVMDVDSTLIQDEVIELIAKHAGVADEVAAVTASAMAGDLDFAESLRHRVALLAGLPISTLEQVRESVRYTPGARTLIRTLHNMGYRVALVSGGFAEIVEPLAAELGVELVRANRLGVQDGKLTGKVSGPIIDREAKAAALHEFAQACGVPVGATIAIGDGANDLDMLAAAGLGIAFNAKPVVQRAADTSLTMPYLDNVLFILGITREEVEAAEVLDL